jgi:hypothetical protein
MDMRGWYSAFWREVRRNPWADGLREAALAKRLKRWTALLTEVAARTCQVLGVQVAARGQAPPALPVPRQEYLGVDLLAFPAAEQPSWRKPILALELENREEPEVIAYALWKVCAVRVAWGGAFCYRREPAAIGELLRALSDGVMRPMEPEHDVLLVVGTRSRAEDFPDGFFKPYVWHRDFRQFRPL